MSAVRNGGAPAVGRSVRRRVALVTAIVIVATIAITVWRGWLPGVPPLGGDAARRVERVIAAGTRVKVEVFNATDTRGLARTAAAELRDAGFDVVFFGNTSERLDSTVVRDRSNHPAWATLAARTMAPATTEVRPDSGRLVDLTVLVGKGWRAPTEPLRP